MVAVFPLVGCVNCLISGVTVKHVESSAHGTLVLPIVALWPIWVLLSIEAFVPDIRIGS